MPVRNVTVRSLKYDRKVRRAWECKLISLNDTLIEVEGVFDTEVKHPGLGNIRRGTISREYYWTTRWYNIFRFLEPNGAFRNYYCNIAMPAVFENEMIEYVDLDIDVIVWPDLSYEIHDRDDFDKNTLRYGYPPDVTAKAEVSLSELIGMIGAGEFPFI
jgi:uncharacterized protein